MLYEFENTTRFVKVIYSENEGNKGIGYTLNRGMKRSNEIIIKMDSDDIMIPNRIQIQLDYMKEPGIAICGGRIMFNTVKEKVINVTQHPDISWEEYKQKRLHWFVNHPTVCYRNSKS